VEGPVKVDRILRDGDKIEIAGAAELIEHHTPGHSPGQIALLCKTENTVFSGDCIPIAGDLPIYDDAAALVKSIKKLRDLKGVELLLSSWDELHRGKDIALTIDKGLARVQQIHEAVIGAKASLGLADTSALAKLVSQKLGLPAAGANPLFARTVDAHLRVIDSPNL
jgi:glyoxylase-like metal-dependent hydrolase (beta-lactamase superfamily II)